MSESDKRPQFGQRYLKDDSRVFEHNAWDDVSWTEEQLNAAKQKVDENSVVRVEPAVRDQYEAEAAQYWDKFYGIHSNRFFKDRHWLFVEFPELLPRNAPAKDAPQDDDTEEYPGKAASLRILEIGCGVGNTVFPILEVNRDPGLFVYGCDFSPTAVSVLKVTMLICNIDPPETFAGTFQKKTDHRINCQKPFSDLVWSSMQYFNKDSDYTMWYFTFNIYI